MASKQHKGKRSSQRSAPARLHTSAVELMGVAAVAALFLVAAVVIMGPSLFRGDSAVAGQASSVPAMETSSGDHSPPPYIPPEGWNEGADIAEQDSSVAAATDW